MHQNKKSKRIIGYARQANPGRPFEDQKALLRDAGCEVVYADMGSGLLEHPELLRMMSDVVPGDTIFVENAERLSRSLKLAASIVMQVEGVGAVVRSLDGDPLTHSPMVGTLVDGQAILRIQASRRAAEGRIRAKSR